MNPKAVPELAKIWERVAALEGEHGRRLRTAAPHMHGALRSLDEPGVRDVLERRGHLDAARWVYSQARPAGEPAGISGRDVLELHSRLLTPLQAASPWLSPERQTAGVLRRNPVRGRDPWEASPPSEVEVLLGAWLRRASALREVEPETLAALHHEFEWIHPFHDANGRVGRLLLHLVAVRVGGLPPLLHGVLAQAYPHAMRAADVGRLRPLADLVAEGMEHARDLLEGSHVTR